MKNEMIEMMNVSEKVNDVFEIVFENYNVSELVWIDVNEIDEEFKSGDEVNMWIGIDVDSEEEIVSVIEYKNGNVEWSDKNEEDMI